jgi:phosphoglycolate phosphatase-like HAD superfamily hydrolase
MKQSPPRRDATAKAAKRGTVPAFDWQNFDAYLFDIDGTLLNSDDAVHYNAFRLALSAIFGVESRLDNIPVHGNTDIGILRAAVSLAGKQAEFESKLAPAMDLIRRQVETNKKHLRPRLCPAIAQLLQRLRSRGKIIGVVTGNLESVGRAKLHAASLDRYFSFGAFCDRCETRSEIFRLGVQQASDTLSNSQSPASAASPEKRHRSKNINAICIVGDTPADIAAARANQVPIIAVATGIYSYADLSRHHPDLCLHSCEELLSSSQS